MSAALHVPPIAMMPCPFCASERICMVSNGMDNIFAECEDCGASGPAHETKLTAAHEWNTRP